MQDILSSLLSQASAKQSDVAKVRWLVQIVKWVQRPRTADEKNTKSETVYTVRLKYLLSMLAKNPDWQQNFVQTISALLAKLSSPDQFCQIGFSSHGFIQDFIHRLQEKILPKNPMTENLESLISEIFPDEEESVYVDFIDQTVLVQLLDLFKEQSEVQRIVKTDILSASYILSVQLLNGLFLIRHELHSAGHKIEEFPEFKLTGALHQHQLQCLLQIEPEVEALLAQVERNIDHLYLSMRREGVKIELVYLFQLQKRRLRRLRTLVNFLDTRIDKAASFRLFVSQLILDTYHNKSFRSFFSENLSLLTERIVQSSSHIGEHYVTYTWSEFKKMFRSASRGGAVTALTVFLKFSIAKIGLAGFLKGFADSLNYSISFLTIQIVGGTLATKQPSNTAPFIANELQKSTIEARRSIVALLRTQFIAVVGNLSLVFPICFLVSYFAWMWETPIISEQQALATVASTNILGPSILYAAFTGVLLFCASLFAGWIENWLVVNQMVHRVELNEKLRRIIGVQRTEKLARFISENSNGLAANIILGFFLGMIPQYTKFLGLGLDVRHVTLATGSFATALPLVLNSGLEAWSFVNALLGIFVIGLLNISVSFSLAFLLASVSSKVRFVSFLRVFWSAAGLILSRPWLLLMPDSKSRD